MRIPFTKAHGAMNDFLAAAPQAVVADRVVAERAVPDRVSPPDHVAPLVQPAELPFDEGSGKDTVFTSSLAPPNLVPKLSLGTRL